MSNNYLPGMNHPDDIEYFSSWTIYTFPLIYVNFLGFDAFDSLTNATAANADLFHYYAANSFRPTNTSFTNSNNHVLRQTTSTWIESSTS